MSDMASNGSPSQYAYNITLAAYDHKISDRDSTKLIGIGHCTTSMARTVLGTEPVTGYTQEPNEAEKDLERRNQGIWVGMWFPEAANYTQTALAATKKREKEENPTASKKPRKRRKQWMMNEAADDDSVPASIGKGESVNSIISKLPLTLVRPEKAWRVVVLLSDVNASYYALFPSGEDLCTGYKVVIDEVFFFEEFRDDELDSKQKRQAGWPALIREARRRLQPLESAPIQQVPGSVAEASTEVVRDSSLHRSIQEMEVTYDLTGDAQQLRDVDEVLNRRALGDRQEDSQRSENILQFAQGIRPLSALEAELASMELKILEPDMGKQASSAPNILYASHGLAAAGLSLTTHQIRPFLVHFEFTISNTGDGATTGARGAYDYTLKLVGDKLRVWPS